MSEDSNGTVRVFHIQPQGARELDAIPQRMPAQGFVWIACTRVTFSARLGALQSALQALAGQQLVDLHVSDLLNAQLPSHYDYTSQYDVLVFRRLSATQCDTGEVPGLASLTGLGSRRAGPPVLRRIDTSPVGFAVFDQVLLSVHPDDCTVRDAFAARLLTANQPAPPPAPAQEPAAETATPGLPTSETLAREQRTGPAPGSRLPTSPADLMLRVVNLIVDNYLDLRRELSRQLDHWQAELLKPRGRFANWSALLDARLTLHQLDEICEDQRAAVQDWVDTLETWALPDNPAALRELELLKVRSRDVLEHIERVVHHVRRLEQSTETAVQMHFSVQSNRTNDIMRTLTALTAVFLPLNLIAGIFGMNFEFIPLVHKQDGFWWAMATMTVIAIALVALFWRKRYLARTGQH
ncbi:magnesium transporter CorA family protein [Paracidovorax citrulli]|uniref:Mg2+ transporter protein, CorA family protein n=2 Tax=Paracidovorax citrulli TaxID=80869 RepID=A1TIZ5_PARC0|nr:Mg2+ transporter protein, CorA family protein [Paracidovorax citrulli AAC00-1]ATG95901.1 magnesium transporter CorA [Paracidovorax citrulli]PVY65110.1 Mg2+ and Co2+ transporter CorA [Paracidovorax citrulli]REG70700.1 Mg2+ and Co2+ transporter CorA [Paracidovorax citrulli]RLJ95252.1 Mg2+ and Co2+ transporter CorA [Paracidovorax citrulli]